MQYFKPLRMQYFEIMFKLLSIKDSDRIVIGKFIMLRIIIIFHWNDYYLFVHVEAAVAVKVNVYVTAETHNDDDATTFFLVIVCYSSNDLELDFYLYSTYAISFILISIHTHTGKAPLNYSIFNSVSSGNCYFPSRDFLWLISFQVLAYLGSPLK